jgi:hypothetical protein
VQPVEEEEAVEEVLPVERAARPRRVRKSRPAPAALPPWYLLALAALPLGLPVVAVVGGWGATLDPGRWARLWLGLGTTLAALALLLACLGKLAAGLRLGLSLGLTAVGYVLVIVVYFGPGAAAGSAAWREVSPPDRRFTVQMPGVPRQEALQRAIRVGGPPQLINTYELVSRNTAFSLRHFELPPNEDPNAFLRDYGQGVVATLPAGSFLNNERPVFHGGGNGKEYVLSIPGQGTMVQRLLLVGRHVYLLGVKGTNVGPNSPDVIRFFNSLSLR